MKSQRCSTFVTESENIEIRLAMVHFNIYGQQLGALKANFVFP